MLPVKGWDIWEDKLEKMNELISRIKDTYFERRTSDRKEKVRHSEKEKSCFINVMMRYITERANHEFSEIFGRNIFDKGNRIDDICVLEKIPSPQMWVRNNGNYSDYEAHVLFDSELAAAINSLISYTDEDDTVLAVNYGTYENGGCGFWYGAWDIMKNHLDLMSKPCSRLTDEEADILAEDICQVIEGIRSANADSWELSVDGIDELEERYEEDDEESEECAESNYGKQILENAKYGTDISKETVAAELKLFDTDDDLTDTPLALLAMYFAGAVDFMDFESVLVYQPVMFKSKSLGEFLENYIPGINKDIDELWEALHSTTYMTWVQNGMGVLMTFSLRENIHCECISETEDEMWLLEMPKLKLAGALCVMDELAEFCRKEKENATERQGKAS